jgi:hypothetical protein
MARPSSSANVPKSAGGALNTPAQESGLQAARSMNSCNFRKYLKHSASEDIHAQERMKQMHGFIARMTHWLDEMQKMDSPTLARLMQMGVRVQKFLDIKDRVLQAFGGKPAGNAGASDSTSTNQGKHGQL